MKTDKEDLKLIVYNIVFSNREGKIKTILDFGIENNIIELAYKTDEQLNVLLLNTFNRKIYNL